MKRFLLLSALTWSGCLFLVNSVLDDGCGDGVVQAEEECDDGNQTNGDGCDLNCTFTACGNGELSPDEVCDDGNTNDGDSCSADCQRAEACGNAAPDPGEECDDGNQTNGDGCDLNCTISRCGNNQIEPKEQCDDGNLTDGDGCDQNCTITACGNGITTLGEGCDDGNNESGDGCSSDCVLEIPVGCGDGVIDDNTEGCDDGNDINGDGCDNNCTITTCGNNVPTKGEDCDDGNQTEGDGCDENCLLEVCGNGEVQDGEECDDNNNVANDGCGPSCDIEFCGDGFIQTGETCDDGNNTDGDGCASDCSLEGASCNPNGILEVGEECDPNLPPAPCQSGEILCTNTCTSDESQCINFFAEDVSLQVPPGAHDLLAGRFVTGTTGLSVLTPHPNLAGDQVHFFSNNGSGTLSQLQAQPLLVSVFSAAVGQADPTSIGDEYIFTTSSGLSGIRPSEATTTSLYAGVGVSDLVILGQLGGNSAALDAVLFGESSFDTLLDINLNVPQVPIQSTTPLDATPVSAGILKVGANQSTQIVIVGNKAGNSDQQILAFEPNETEISSTSIPNTQTIQAGLFADTNDDGATDVIVLGNTSLTIATQNPNCVAANCFVAGTTRILPVQSITAASIIRLESAPHILLLVDNEIKIIDFAGQLVATIRETASEVQVADFSNDGDDDFAILRPDGSITLFFAL
jgi:cysteine-rich repeat protein